MIDLDRSLPSDAGPDWAENPLVNPLTANNPHYSGASTRMAPSRFVTHRVGFFLAPTFPPKE